MHHVKECFTDSLLQASQQDTKTQGVTIEEEKRGIEAKESDTSTTRPRYEHHSMNDFTHYAAEWLDFWGLRRGRGSRSNRVRILGLQFSVETAITAAIQSVFFTVAQEKRTQRSTIGEASCSGSLIVERRGQQMSELAMLTQNKK